MVDKEVLLINKLLLRHYPVIKVKDRRKFKRAISLTINSNNVIETGSFIIKNHKQLLKTYIVERLFLCVGVSKNKIVSVVDSYLN